MGSDDDLTATDQSENVQVKNKGTWKETISSKFGLLVSFYTRQKTVIKTLTCSAMHCWCSYSCGWICGCERPSNYNEN